MSVGGNADLTPGRLVRRAGLFTKAAYLRSAEQTKIEARLGYRPGRLDAGWWLLFLTEMPGPDEFEVRVPAMHGGGHEHDAANPAAARRARERLIAEVFTLKGSARLAMAVPRTGGPDDHVMQEFPQGHPIPQWELLHHHALTWKVAAFLQGGEVYNGFYV